MQVNIHDSKTHFSRLVDRALEGEDVFIARNGKTLLKLVPIAPVRTRRTLGLSAGKGRIAPDFDEELPDDVMASFVTKDHFISAYPGLELFWGRGRMAMVIGTYLDLRASRGYPRKYG